MVITSSNGGKNGNPYFPYQPLEEHWQHSRAANCSILYGFRLGFFSLFLRRSVHQSIQR